MHVSYMLRPTLPSLVTFVISSMFTKMWRRID